MKADHASRLDNHLLQSTTYFKATFNVTKNMGLLFKGQGFYITDYGKDGKKDRQKAKSRDDSSGSSEKSGESAQAQSADVRRQSALVRFGLLFAAAAGIFRRA